MKKISIWVICFVLIGIAMGGYAEGSAFSKRFLEYKNKAKSTFFLNDGRVLFALYHNETYTENNYVDSIVCLASNGDILWQRDIPPSGRRLFIAIEQIVGGKFALAGEYVNGGFFILLIDADGNDIETINLDDDALFPVLTSDSAFYLSKQSGSIVQLRYDDVSPRAIDGISGNGLLFAVEGDGEICFSVIGRMDGEMINSVLLCVDLQGKLKWSYELGGYMNWQVHPFTYNSEGGITVPVTYKSDNGNTLYIMCLDANGEMMWKREVSSPDLSYPTVHVMRQNEKGEYQMWGIAEQKVNQLITFSLYLDSNGLYLDSNFKSQRAGCYPYVNGEIYAVVIDDIGLKQGATAIMPFDNLMGSPAKLRFSVR